MTWKLMGMIINRKQKANTVINKLLYNNKCYTDKLSICDQLNAYFINVGSSLSSKLPNRDNVDPTKYIHRAFSNSFKFGSIDHFTVSCLVAWPFSSIYETFHISLHHHHHHQENSPHQNHP